MFLMCNIIKSGQNIIKGVDVMDYQILVNKSNGISEDYFENVIKPSVVPVDTIKNNDIVYKTFGIEDCTTYLEKTTAKQFEKLKKYAKQNGLVIDITSGYLSFEQQKKKYDYFVNKHGIEFAEKSACLPGYSEHNTGLCIDCDIFRNGKWAGIALNKDGSINEETAWLHTVLHKFGFILRYPKGKEDITKMKFEPWHIRYVGEKVAEYIYDNNLTLEEYHELKSKI